MHVIRITTLAVSLSVLFSLDGFSAEKKQSAPKEEKKGSRPDAVEFNAKDVWDVDIFNREDHKVLVIQDRKYNKKGRLEISLGAVLNSADPYYNSYGASFGLGYHISEYLGVESTLSASTGGQTKYGKRLDEFLDGNGFSSQTETKRPSMTGTATAVWSPIYGKFAFFRESIVHFDFYGEAGLALVQDQSVYLPNNSEGKFNTQPGVVYGLGSKVFIDKSWMLKFNWKHYIYHARFNGFSNNSETVTVEAEPFNTTLSAFQFTLGVSYLINVGGF